MCLLLTMDWHFTVSIILLIKCIYEWTNRLCMYKCLLTNCLHGKAAELYLANSRNLCVTITKYLEYINSVYGTCYYFYTCVSKVLL